MIKYYNIKRNLLQFSKKKKNSNKYLRIAKRMKNVFYENLTPSRWWIRISVDKNITKRTNRIIFWFINYKYTKIEKINSLFKFCLTQPLDGNEIYRIDTVESCLKTVKQIMYSTFVRKS